MVIENYRFTEFNTYDYCKHRFNVECNSYDFCKYRFTEFNTCDYCKIWTQTVYYGQILAILIKYGCSKCIFVYELFS